MGATCTVSIEKEDPLKIVSALTSGEGADLVCEMSGHPSAIAQGLAMAANGGRFHILSLPEHPVTIDLTNKVVLHRFKLFYVLPCMVFFHTIKLCF